MNIGTLVLSIIFAFLAYFAWKREGETNTQRDVADIGVSTPVLAEGYFERPPGRDVVYLDFDGVLHPGNSESFEFRDNFERIVRRHPGVDIVLSTDWRSSADLSYLRGRFSQDIARRIVGCTPRLNGEHARYLEIKHVNDKFGIDRWLAIDDSSELFPIDCPNLVLVDRYTGISGKGELIVVDAFSRAFA